MKEFKHNLQFFAEGGDGAGAGAEGSNLGVSVGAENGLANQTKGDLSNVIYGKASMTQEQTTGEEAKTPTKTKAQAFEDLIKGEYKDEFAKRTQGIIDERFKKTKGIESELNDFKAIGQRLSEKYGVDANDKKALLAAIDNDESFYEREALEKGLTVSQLKEIKAIERENAQLKEAQEKAAAKEHSEKIYSDWLHQGEELKQKYGLQDFDLAKEAENPDFCRMLEMGISLESAYKAIHIDDMIGGAMAATAQNVRKSIVDNVANRSGRPSENAASSPNSQIFKTDVNSLTKADREEIERRVMRGEEITF